MQCAHLIVAALMERRVAAAVPAPRVQQAEAFARKPRPHERAELLHLVPVRHALQQSAA
jgi:hypothetical protein